MIVCLDFKPSSHGIEEEHNAATIKEDTPTVAAKHCVMHRKMCGMHSFLCMPLPHSYDCG